MSEFFTAAGLTTVHDADALRQSILPYEDTRRHGELRHRVCIMMDGPALFSSFKAAGIYTGFGDEWVRIGGVKYVADGSASERTMRMSTPYVGTNDYGILTMTQQEIHDAVDDAHQHNFQVGIHANGDVTIDMVLKAYERALAKWPDPKGRHRIEHCSLVNPDPDAGIPVPGASDYTPKPFEPLMAIQSMVTRTDYNGRVWGANQRVTVDEALTIATLNGAYAASEEQLKGSITACKLADFVILEKDPHDVHPGEIKDIRIARTVVGGKTMYPKERA